MAAKKEIVINLTSPFNNTAIASSPRIRKSPTFKDVYKFKDLNVNVKLYLFWIQGVFSVIVIAFCFTMLVRGGEVCEYIAVITGILGYWLPSPNYHNAFLINNKEDNSNQGKKVSYVSNNNIIIETLPQHYQNKRRLSLDSALETYKTAESIPFEIEVAPKPTNIRKSIEKIIKKK